MGHGAPSPHDAVGKAATRSRVQERAGLCETDAAQRGSESILQRRLLECAQKHRHCDGVGALRRVPQIPPHLDVSQPLLKASTGLDSTWLIKIVVVPLLKTSV